jgi:hypothetical protein
MLARLQRLRGSVYLEDGAIREKDLTSDGRHVSPADEHSWHVLTVEAGGVVRGCARYLAHDWDISFNRLTLRTSALAQDLAWGSRLRKAVESEIALARSRGLAYAEVGGWAIHSSIRSGTEAMRIALGTYALSRRLGGCIGITTATLRHHSATTLQRIGGSVLEYGGSPLPYYFDPQYGCEMAIIRFRSANANPRIESWIRCLEIQMRTVPVIYSAASLPIHIPELEFARSAVA